MIGAFLGLNDDIVDHTYCTYSLEENKWSNTGYTLHIHENGRYSTVINERIKEKESSNTVPTCSVSR